MNLDRICADGSVRTRLEFLAQKVKSDRRAKCRYDERVAEVAEWVETSSQLVIDWMVEHKDELGVVFEGTTCESRGLTFTARVDKRELDINVSGDPVAPEVELGEYTVKTGFKYHADRKPGEANWSKLVKLPEPIPTLELRRRVERTYQWGEPVGLHKLEVLNFLLSEVTPRDFEPHKDQIRNLYGVLPYEERLLLLREFAHDGLG